jgi:RecA-family ATPase
MTDAEIARLRSDGALLRSIVGRTVKLKKEGGELKGCCPFHNEKTASFTLYDNGHYHCFGCSAHGTVFDYLMQTEGIDFGEACRRLAADAGISTAVPKHKGNGSHKGELWQPAVPPPASAPRPDARQLEHCILFEYIGPDGNLLFYQRRFEKGGGKSFAQLTYGTLTRNGHAVTGWHSKGPPQPYPLYRLDRLRQADPDSTVIVVEGEGKCEAAERLFPDAVSTAWLNGANSVRLTDWSPLKRFKETNIIWWPDADKPRADGKPHGCFLATPAFRKLFPRARWIDTTSLDDIKDGYDAKDLEDDGCDDPDVWLQARLREPEQNDANHALPDVAWRDVRLSDWANRDLPERLWIVPDWIPREQTTGLYGVGGINKTDFLLQLLMASSAGLPFLGYALTPLGPVYGLFCEDSEAELVRRASRIAVHYHRSLADFPDVHFASLVGYDDPEFVSFDGPKPMNGAALLRFDRMIMQLGAKLATLDTAPDFFGGTEISRRDVTRFVRKLDAVSMTRSCAILFTAHPSVRGRTSGSFDSGSTGWEAKVRARLSLHDPGNEDDEDADKKANAPQPPSERRILTRQKANYARPGETIELICRNGVFTTAALDTEQAAKRAGGPTRNAACDDQFLALIPKAESAIRYVHDASSAPSHYAPAVFAARKDSGGYSRAEFTRAMRRLLETGRIRSIPFGAPSKGRSKSEIVQQS